ncbi:hypothetical protein [Streptomyces sp. NPDC057616]|uniref:hypothetical protein n=1 Tax=Streptomyces sp. NPDC057616 TaxID=3346183 RepID=UPI0036A021C7
MTEIPAEVFASVARKALQDLSTAPDLRVLEALAGCDVLIRRATKWCSSSTRGTRTS